MMKKWRPNLMTSRLSTLAQLANDCVRSGRACFGFGRFTKWLRGHFWKLSKYKRCWEKHMLPCAFSPYSVLDRVCLQWGKLLGAVWDVSVQGHCSSYLSVKIDFCVYSVSASFTLWWLTICYCFGITSYFRFLLCFLTSAGKTCVCFITVLL